MSAAIRAEGLAKAFHLAPAETGPLAARLARRGREALASLRRRAAPPDDPTLFWALRDVSFEVPEGEVVGVIGHNGAGKSTLLKILARITEPTRGNVRIRGRMAALLEVGTGFHPDLSGRDNVYLNAAILGMSRAEIRKRFDSIVDFAGVTTFIDTPIKHYSSGMKVRLAFAVAAHLEPEILVIDEVLAVGDAAFQKKSLNRIEEAGTHGRTVLLVSHNLGTVARLCSRVIVLDHGRIAFDGPAVEGIRHYNETLGHSRARRAWPEGEQPGDVIARLRSAELIVDGEVAHGPVDVRKPLGVRFRYAVLADGRRLMPSVHVLDSGGNWVFAAVDLEPQWHNRPRPAGEYLTTAWLPPNLLNEGPYSVSLSLASIEPLQPHCFAHDCLGFTVFDRMEGDTTRGQFRGEIPGVVRPALRWETVRV